MPDQMISCCMIVRDEGSNLRECLESVRPHVDELVVVDTGSKDESTVIAQEFADHWEQWTGCNDDEGRILDFSAARMRAHDAATGDWMFWIDGDDVLVGGEMLRELAHEDQAAAPGAAMNAIVLPYEYQHDQQGRCSVLQYRERLLFPRTCFRWQCPVHEGCLPRPDTGKGLITRGAPDGIRIIHKHPPEKVKEAGRNLRILESYVQKNGEGDPRAMFYLGLERAINGRLDDAQSILERYVELARWNDERCVAMLELANLSGFAGRYHEAIEWGLRATQEKSWPAPFWSIGRAYYSMAASGESPDLNFRRAIHHFMLGRTLLDHRSTVLIQHPMEEFEIERHLNVSFAAIGDLDRAIESCKRGLGGMPEDHALAQNLRLYERDRRRKTVVDLARELRDRGDLSESGLALVEATISGAARVTLEPVAGSTTPTGETEPASPRSQSSNPESLDVVLFVGRGLEPWTPRSLREHGMGGSETMALNLAEGLARSGHCVRVYAHCEGPGMVVGPNGMSWRDESDFHDLICDVLISSRRPDAVDKCRRVVAKKSVLWVHDVHCDVHLTPERAQHFDEIWCLSRWHMENMAEAYPWLQKDKLVQIRNGIDLALWGSGPDYRNPHRAVYSSSPDRGLPLALELWPRVREKVPDAELHVYYGFDNWIRVCELTGRPTDELRAIRRTAESTPGVFLHGRVNEAQLAEEFFRAGVWAYPTWWYETSCITAMQALAAGLCIVTTNRAALYETVGTERGRLLNEDYGSDEYKNEWVESVVDAMHCSPDADIRRTLHEYSRRFDLTELVMQLESRLKELLSTPLVPAFTEEGL